MTNVDMILVTNLYGRVCYDVLNNIFQNKKLF